MRCFTDPLTTIYLRDVTESVNTIDLKMSNKKGRDKLERFKIGTETLSHEMRTPLVNIVTIIDVLLHINATNINE